MSCQGKSLWQKIKCYAGFWVWRKPLNWSNATESDWVPSWLANYLVVAEALVLLVWAAKALL